jgi:hypothetical protein
MTNRWAVCALSLEASPLLAFVVLAMLCPVGDPQASHSVLVRLLDFQGTYWMRAGIPVPPPMLIAGLLMSLYLRFRRRAALATWGVVCGGALLFLWLLLMCVPYLCHVN